MNYRVEIDFTRGPGLGMNQEAETEAEAIQKTKEFARECGYTSPIKKVKAWEVPA